MSAPSDGIDRPVLDEIIDASPVVVFALRRTDAGLFPVWMCPNVERILERRPIPDGDADWWHDAVHPDDRATVETMRSRLDGGHPQRFEFRLLDGAGSYRWIREEIRAPSSRESESVDAVGSWSDVTALRQLQARLRRSGQMEAVGRLIGGVAHEFNNLLTVVRGNADLLDSGVGDDPELAGNLEAVKRAADEAKHIVSDLLAHLPEGDDGRAAVELEPLFRKVRPVLSEILGEGIELRIECDDDLPPVAIAPADLERALGSLAANARDAVEGEGRVRVQARSRTVALDDPELPDVPPGRYVVVRFEDTGEGMDRRTSERAFDPFFTTRADRDRSGLGLSAVYGSVIRAGGTVEIESARGEGTTVILYLRADRPGDGSAEA